MDDMVFPKKKEVIVKDKEGKEEKQMIYDSVEVDEWCKNEYIRTQNVLNLQVNRCKILDYKKALIELATELNIEQ